MDGALRIRKIRIRKLGSVEDLELVFHKRVSCVSGTAWKEILLAFRLIGGNEVSEEETALFGQGFCIMAEFLSGGTLCRLEITREKDAKGLNYAVAAMGQDPCGNREAERMIRKYLRELPERKKLRVLYDAEEQGIRERFSVYENTEDPAVQELLYQETSGISGTSLFRDCLRESLREAEEQALLNGEKNTRVPELFFRLNRFWEAVGQIRDFQGLRFPPLVLAQEPEILEKEGVKNCQEWLRKQYEGQLIAVFRQVSSASQP